MRRYQREASRSPLLPNTHLHSPMPSLTFSELFVKLVYLPTLAETYSFSAQLYLWYLNVPVIGEGGTTFLFVFLKNPSSGLLK